MSVAPILALRKAIVAHLRADAGVTATAIAARSYGEKAPAQPTWPFLRYGMADGSGVDVSIPLHLFSKSPFTDDLNAAAEAVGQSLDGKVLVLGDGRKAHLTWAGVRNLAGEDEWQAIVTIAARVPRDCG